MKKNFMTLAFMLVFASITVFADGEVGHGTRTEPTPPPVTTSNRTPSPDTSDTLFNQILNAIYAFAA